jgi:hypothetical protein
MQYEAQIDCQFIQSSENPHLGCTLSQSQQKARLNKGGPSS